MGVFSTPVQMLFSVIIISYLMYFVNTFFNFFQCGFYLKSTLSSPKRSIHSSALRRAFFSSNVAYHICHPPSFSRFSRSCPKTHTSYLVIITDTSLSLSIIIIAPNKSIVNTFLHFGIKKFFSIFRNFLLDKLVRFVV